MQLGEASRVAPVDKLSVVFALALAIIFLKEKMAWHQWLGSSLIVIGAAILSSK